MRFPPCTCTSSPRPLPLCTPHTTLLFSAPTLLSCHAAPLIRFRFQPEGPGESPWRATWNDEERRTGDSGYPRANREKERGRERVISEGCEPRTRIYLYSFVAGITDHPPREITREEIFGIEWTIMRLHLNNLRGVDWLGRAWRVLDSRLPIDCSSFDLWTKHRERNWRDILGQRERDFLARYACSLGTNGSSLSLSRF